MSKDDQTERDRFVAILLIISMCSLSVGFCLQWGVPAMLIALGALGVFAAMAILDS